MVPSRLIQLIGISNMERRMTYIEFYFRPRFCLVNGILGIQVHEGRMLVLMYKFHVAGYGFKIADSFFFKVFYLLI